MSESMDESINDPVTVAQKTDSLNEATNNLNISQGSSDNLNEENIDANLTKEEDSVNVEEQKRNVDEQLRLTLKGQLEYYFSPSNLVRDSFLCSVMTTSSSSTKDQENNQITGTGSEGKYAPISLIERFGNIQRIIHHYESQRQQIALYANASHDAIESESYYKIIPELLRDSALLSSSLKVTILDTNISQDSANDDAAAPTDSDNENVSASADILTTNVFRLGVGPIQSIWDETEKLKASGDDKDEKKAEKNIIIIRDMPTTATEEEIKDIFNWEGCPEVKSIHSDVGNSWFVSLDGSHEQIVDILLELKNKKFKGEHVIKARLKTESIAKSTAPTNFFSSQFSGYNNSNVGGMGRPQYYRRSGKFGLSDQYTYRSRYQQSAPYSNASRRPGADRGGMRGRGSRPSTYGKPAEEKPKVAAVPPPPLEMESHFPALGASPPPATSKDEVKENSVEADSSNDLGTAGEVEVETVSSEKKEMPTAKTVVQESVKKSGYAAALLKAAPNPSPTQPAPKQISKSNTSSHQKKKFIVTVPFHKGGNNNASNQAKDTKSAGSTATTDPADRFSDSSTSSTSAADEKSSSSFASSPTVKEADKTSSGTKTVPSWGGKKSFADILKLREQQKLRKKSSA